MANLAKTSQELWKRLTHYKNSKGLGGKITNASIKNVGNGQMSLMSVVTQMIAKELEDLTQSHDTKVVK